MNNEEKFKNSIRELFDEKQFSYDADNWEAASRELDKKENRKKRFLFFLFAILGLGIAVSGYFLVPLKMADRTGAQLNTKEVSRTTSLLNDHAGQQQKDMKETTTRNTVGKTVTENRPLINKPSNLGGAKNVVPQSSLLASAPGDKAEQVNAKAVLFAEMRKMKQKNRKTELPVAMGTIRADMSRHLNAATSSQNREDSNENKSKEVVGANNGLPDGVAAPLLTDKDLQQKDSGQTPEAVAMVKTDQTDEPAGKSVTLIKDTSSKTNPEPLAPVATEGAVLQPTVQNAPKTNFLFAEAGAYFNFGWQYKGSAEATGINPYVGLSYLTKLSDKLAFSFGAYYTTLSNLKLDTKVIKTPRVVFGEENDVIAITPVTLNYLLIPAKIQYSIDAKQAVTLGYNLGYLFDVQSNVQTYSEGFSGVVGNKTSYKTRGYMEGFKTFNSQIAIGYRRMLYKNLWINGEILYGLTDLRDNTFFGINFKEKMTGLKISLTYDLLKK